MEESNMKMRKSNKVKSDTSLPQSDNELDKLSDNIC